MVAMTLEIQQMMISSLEPPIANLDDKFSNDENIDSGRDEATARCPSCNFVSWFMLDEMPGFLSQFEDDESNEDALQFVKDSYEKFHVFLGHKVRCANQNQAILAGEEDMIARCRKDKNIRPLHLKLVADFKMKWEAMYQHELMTESYGKRGISWHGFLIIYYLWDEDTGAPMRHVLKLDQILEGANKQDGVTVLALLEAAMVFVSDEFGQDVVIDCLQTDNAAAYHKKALVLGIAILNAVSTNVCVYFLVLGMLRFVTHHLIACLYRK